MIYTKANGPFGLITFALVAVIDYKCLRKVFMDDTYESLFNIQG